MPWVFPSDKLILVSQKPYSIITIYNMYFSHIILSANLDFYVLKLGISGSELLIVLLASIFNLMNQ